MKGSGLEGNGGAPPEFAVRARQLLELYQKALSDYQAHILTSPLCSDFL